MDRLTRDHLGHNTRTVYQGCKRPLPPPCPVQHVQCLWWLGIRCPNVIGWIYLFAGKIDLGATFILSNECPLFRITEFTTYGMCTDPFSTKILYYVYWRRKKSQRTIAVIVKGLTYTFIDWKQFLNQWENHHHLTLGLSMLSQMITSFWEYLLAAYTIRASAGHRRGWSMEGGGCYWPLWHTGLLRHLDPQLLLQNTSNLDKPTKIKGSYYRWMKPVPTS